jgi:membrane-associated protease RseP (regulator of RpoE activity)
MSARRAPSASTHGRSLARAATVALAVIGLLAGNVGPAGAQGADAAERDRPGWLGIGILQGSHCDSMPEDWRDGDGDARQGCRRVVLVDAVIDGSPAQRAGIRPGDTLVAVNGEPVSRESGRRALVSLVPGEPAEVAVGREEGRTTIEVIPEPRPPRAGPVPVHLGDGPAGGVPALVHPRKLTAPEAPEGAGASGAPPIEVVGTGGAELAGIRMAEDGSVYLVRSDGKSVLLHRLRAAGPRMRQIQDSVLAEARQRIRALRAHQREVARMQRSAAEAQAGELAATGRLRAAGAEFRSVGGSLSEYFPGVEEGLLVLQVVPETPAASLGIRPGDVVVEAGGRSVRGPADLHAALSGFTARDSVRVVWIRRGERMSGALTHR